MSIKFSGNDNYTTPEYLFHALNDEFGFDLDPCPLNPTPSFFEDGLQSDWSDKRVFVNPPWSNIMPWVKKAFESDAQVVVLLIPARTDTRWFHALSDGGADIRLFRKRVHFLKNGIGGNRMPTDGIMVAVIRPQKEVRSEQRMFQIA